MDALMIFSAVLAAVVLLIVFTALARALFSLFMRKNKKISFSQHESISEIPQFTPEDRILVLAPHPDDEAIGASGIIQRALSSGAKVKIAYLTNGDSNELSFIVFEKKPMIMANEVKQLGRIRINESREAMKVLGLSPKSMVFLGYPDFGTLNIFTEHWKSNYRSPITRFSRVSYENALSPGSRYTGESILSDLTSVIKKFRATKIFVSSPADRNPDHQALFLFTSVALLDISGGRFSKTGVFPYLVHFRNWPKPLDYHPGIYMKVPAELFESGMRLKRISLSPSELSRKHEAVLAYKSQIKYSPQFLPSFARQDEIFGDYPLFMLKKQQEDSLLWEGFEKISVPELRGKYSGALESYSERDKSLISKVSYAHSGDFLFVKLNLRNNFEPDRKISLFIFGYSNKTNFSEMPKIHILISPFLTRVYDGEKLILFSRIFVTRNKNEILVKVPLEQIGNPKCILTATRTRAEEIPVSETSWRMLALE